MRWGARASSRLQQIIRLRKSYQRNRFTVSLVLCLKLYGAGTSKADKVIIYLLSQQMIYTSINMVSFRQLVFYKHCRKWQSLLSWTPSCTVNVPPVSVSIYFIILSISSWLVDQTLASNHKHRPQYKKLLVFKCSLCNIQKSQITKFYFVSQILFLLDP